MHRETHPGNGWSWKTVWLITRFPVCFSLIEDYRIALAKGYGVVEAGMEQRVTPETLFETISIVKPDNATVPPIAG